MTSKERVNAALNFQETDHVPVAVFDAGVWISEHTGLSLQEIMDLEDGGAEIAKEYYDILESDIVYAGAGTFGAAIQAFGAKADFSGAGISADISPLSNDPEFYKTIDLSSVRETLLANPGIQSQLRQTRRLKELVGDEKYVSTLTGAPFTNAGVLFGVQDLMLCLLDGDIDLKPLFDLGAAIAVENNNLLLEAGADMVFMGDAVASGTLISQKMYNEIVFPLTKRVIEQLENPEHIFIHICGDVTSRLEGMAGLGIDGFSVEGVNLAEALPITYGKYSIMGNLVPYDVMVHKTPKEVYAISEELCKTAGRKGGFILAPGCDLPSKAPLENVLAMVSAAKACNG